MTADPVLVLAWLVLAHLAADFVFQGDRLARDKFGDGGRAARALLIHGAVVGAAVSPLAVVFGAPGAAAVMLIVATHVAIDRAKVVLTRRGAEDVPLPAPSGGDPDAPRAWDAAALGPAWTPRPAALFALDQAAHLAVLGFAWTAFLSAAKPLPIFSDAVRAALGEADHDAFHAAALTVVVLTGLVIVNVRAGSLFVATLVRPGDPLAGASMSAGARTTAPIRWPTRSERAASSRASSRMRAPRGPRDRRHPLASARRSGSSSGC